MKARPSFQFYPSDWLRDPGLRSCSLAARGLWIDMLTFMHEAEPYGHLRLKGRDIGPDILSRMVGTSMKVARRLLTELETAGVFSRTAQGTIYSRRMVKDEAMREKRGQFGHLSENHPLVPRKKGDKDTGKDGEKDTIQPSFGGSPSYSSSPSKKESPLPPKGVAAVSNGLQPEEILRKWNALPSVKPCKALDDDIRTRILTRLNKHPDPMWWDGLFQQVTASDFLCGRTNGTRGAFQATLDWVLGPKNLGKILRGNYDTGRSASKERLPL